MDVVSCARTCRLAMRCFCLLSALRAAKQLVVRVTQSYNRSECSVEPVRQKKDSRGTNDAVRNTNDTVPRQYTSIPHCSAA